MLVRARLRLRVEVTQGREVTTHGVLVPASHRAGQRPRKAFALETLGPPLAEPQLLEIPLPRRSEAEIRGRVAHIDRFGNLITDIPTDWADRSWGFVVGGSDVGSLRGSYSEVESGELVVVVGSMGTVEIAARDASAAIKLGAARGDPVFARR